MKKKNIFVTMFFLLFFCNTGIVKADVPLQCKIGDDNCTIDNVKNEITNKDSGNTPLCIYEVEFGKNKYYNYIFNSTNVGNTAGIVSYISGTTFSSINTIRWSTIRRQTNLFAFSDSNASKNDIHYITDDAFNSLNNGTCPSYSHFGHDILKGGYLCYDNDADGSGCNNSSLVSLYPESGDSKLVYSYSGNLDFTVDSKYVDYCNINKKEKKYCIYYDSELKSNNFFVFGKNSLNGYTSKFNKVFNAESIYYRFINDTNSAECPSKIYEYVNYNKVTFLPHESSDYGKLSTTYLLSSCDEDNKPNFNTDEIGCEIFTPSLRKIINEIMSFIRIGVPLLLIVLLGVDFAKATFSGDEKAISKSKSNAVKRIVIAIIIFFVPAILNLLFDVANKVWENAHYEVCVLNEENN